MNENNNTRKITEGIISEIELVELFATQKQKDKYYSNGNMFTSHNKETVLKQAKRECEVECLGKREYKIYEIYKYPVPKNFDSMNKGLHKYLIPLILNNLIYAVKIYEIDNITFSTTRWFEAIDLINRNYMAMKSNIDYSCKKISVDKNLLSEYFSNTDDALLYLFKKSLVFCF